jgi:hypothetical protein
MGSGLHFPLFHQQLLSFIQGIEKQLFFIHDDLHDSQEKPFLLFTKIDGWDRIYLIIAAVSYLWAIRRRGHRS